MRLLLACALAYLSACAAAKPDPALPGPPSPLPGWDVVGRDKATYLASLDPDVTREGRASVYFRQHGVWTRDCPGPCPETYAAVITSFDAAPFRGRRAHAVVWIRTGSFARNPLFLKAIMQQGRVGLRVQPQDAFPDGPWTSASVVHLRPETDFTRYDLTIEVPDDAKRIDLGVSVAPFGEAFIDPVVQIEAQ
jgi:hypothetical protein